MTSENTFRYSFLIINCLNPCNLWCMINKKRTMTLYPKLILDALATVRYPGNGKNIVEAEMVADNMRIDGRSASRLSSRSRPTRL